MLHEDFYSSDTYANRELGIFFACSPVDAGQLPNFAWNKARKRKWTRVMQKSPKPTEKQSRTQ